MKHKWHYFNEEDGMCKYKSLFPPYEVFLKTACNRDANWVIRHTEDKNSVDCINCLRNLNRRGQGMKVPETDIPKLIAEEVSRQVENSIARALNSHTKALACHCECLAFNSANMAAAIQNGGAIYGEDVYWQVMQKWGLVNEKGEPLI